jgi:PHD/YefM family antitoxin component YafN of YafNO toxin-antitoxin module
LRNNSQKIIIRKEPFIIPIPKVIFPDYFTILFLRCEKRPFEHYSQTQGKDYEQNHFPRKVQRYNEGQLKGVRDFMPRIRPETDLRDCYEEISNYCREKKEPIFITRQGHGDLAIMSLEVYELLVQSMDIFRLDRLLQEGKVTEVSGAMNRINTASGNVRELSDAAAQKGEDMLQAAEDAGAGAREFLFRGAAQAKQDAPAGIGKSRQEFVKPKE